MSSTGDGVLGLSCLAKYLRDERESRYDGALELLHMADMTSGCWVSGTVLVHTYTNSVRLASVDLILSSARARDASDWRSCLVTQTSICRTRTL